MSRQRRNRNDSLTGTKKVESDRIQGFCDVDKDESNTALFVVVVQRVDGNSNMLIWNVTTCQAVIPGNDADCV